MSTAGLSAPFEVLWEESLRGTGLPEGLRATYGGDWIIPDSAGGIYRYSNFVMSHDGRVSFNIEGHEGGGDVSDFNAHDQWLMGLLRARADAVMVGANTLRSESEHRWTSAFIYPADEPAFAALRVAEGRRPLPYQVMVTRTGDLPKDAAIFHDPDLDVLVVTTKAGARALTGRPNLTLIVAGDDDLDTNRAHEILHDEFGVRTLLCEGGPRVYGSLLAAGQLDEEFLTWSPVVIGTSEDEPRPGLIEGVALQPSHSSRSHLISVRRAGDHLFVRSRYTNV
jgi:riboflavin biosynthesis pyrimidine reductase